MPRLGPSGDCVRTAEVIGALSLATDLALGMEIEHGLQSALVAMRLGDRLGIDDETRSQALYVSLLFYVGCAADADVAAELFPHESALMKHFTPVMMGSRTEMLGGIVRALGSTRESELGRIVEGARRLPRAALTHRHHLAAVCEVATMLTERLGLPASVNGLFAHLTERWDGKGEPGLVKGDSVPLAVRVAHVARDAVFQSGLDGAQFAARVVRDRAGGAFDPAVASALADDADAILSRDGGGSLWDEILAYEPEPVLTLEGDAIDRAMAAMGDFTDLSSPYLAGHSEGVEALTARAAPRCGFDTEQAVELRRAAFVHDLVPRP